MAFFPSNWRDAGLPGKLLGLNSYVAVPWVLLLFRANWFTFFLSLSGTVLFIFLGYYGFGPMEASGRLMDAILGQKFLSGKRIRFYEEEG